MRIPSYAVLLFSTLLLVGVVHGANITIGPTQGHVEYRITLSNQTSTLVSFLLNESAQPTGQNGIVLTLRIVNTGNTQITFKGQSFQGTIYQVAASATYASTTASVSANGTIITMPSGLIYSVQLESINSYSVQMRL